MKELQLSERANGLGQVRCQNAHACRFLYFKVYVLPAGPISTSFYKCRPNELVDIVNMLAFFIFIFDLFVFCLFVCLFVCFCLKIYTAYNSVHAQMDINIHSMILKIVIIVIIKSYYHDIGFSIIAQP